MGGMKRLALGELTGVFAQQRLDARLVRPLPRRELLARARRGARPHAAALAARAAAVWLHARSRPRQ